jgi:hypothetical protein
VADPRRFADPGSGDRAACANGRHAWVEEVNGALRCEICGEYSGCNACAAEREGVPGASEWTHVGGCGDG